MESIPLRLISHPSRPYLHDAPNVTIPPNSKVLDLKLAIQNSWEGHPKVEGVTLTLAGRLLQDSELVNDLLKIGTEDDRKPIIHVMVRPSAWTTFFAPPIPMLSNTNPIAVGTSVAATALTPNPTPVASSSTFLPRVNTSSIPRAVPVSTPITPYTTYLSHLSQLIPLQRSLLLLNLQKSHHFYASLVQHRLGLLGWADENIMSLSLNSLVPTDESSSASIREKEGEEEWKTRMGIQEVEEVVQLLKGCGLYNLVEASIKDAEDHIKNWTERDLTDIAGKRKGEFEVVQLGGLPFLLHTPAPFMSPIPCPPLEPFLALKRAQSILQVLTTMLQLLLTFQPTAGSVAYGRAMLQSVPGIQPDLQPPATPATIRAELRDLRGELGGLEGALGGMRALAPPPRRRPVISIVLNLNITRFLSIFIPLFFLGLKLGFLLWIFGRHASQTKQMILGGIALIYLIWEGFTLYRRGNPAVPGQAPRRVRVRQPAVPAGNIPPPADPLPPGLRQRHVGVPAAGVIPVPAPIAGGRVHRERPERPTPSLLSPRYWINYISAIGLASEALELGLIPRSIAGRPVTLPSPLPILNPNDRIGLARERRRKALRTVMIGVVLFFGTLLPEVERKRRRALEKRAKLLENRRLSRERRSALAAEASAAVARAAQLAAAATVLAATPSSSIAPAGRAVISDAALFADSLPDSAIASTSSSLPTVASLTPPTPTTTSSVETHPSTSTLSDNGSLASRPPVEINGTLTNPSLAQVDTPAQLEAEVEGENEVDIGGSDEEDDVEAAREAREAEQDGADGIF